MRILLIEVPGFHMNGEPVFQLGLAYLLASVKKAGYEARGVVFLREDYMNEALPGWVKGYKPDVVGISCNTFNRGNVKKAIEIIKSISKVIRIVVGGVHATYLGKQVLDYGANYVIGGEGENTFVDLCKAIERDGDFSLVKDLFYYCNGLSWRTMGKDPIENLDDLPQPDFSYARDLIQSANMGWTITSRGCPAKCGFCSTSSYWGQKVRTHSVKRVVDDLEMIVSRFGVNRIFFHDDTFNINVNRVLGICKEILSRGLKIRWGVSCRVYPVSAEMIEAMVGAGCSHISFGIESGSQEIMKWMGKKITYEQIRNAYKLCEPYSKKGLLSTGAFMMVGFPGETEQTVRETIDFLNTISLTDRPCCSVLYVLPGTRLWEEQKVLTDDYWAKTDDVLYSNSITGQNLGLLYKWGAEIEKAGQRIPFDEEKHFWNDVIKGKIPETKCPVYREGL